VTGATNRSTGVSESLLEEDDTSSPVRNDEHSEDSRTVQAVETGAEIDGKVNSTPVVDEAQVDDAEAAALEEEQEEEGDEEYKEEEEEEGDDSEEEEEEEEGDGDAKEAEISDTEMKEILGTEPVSVPSDPVEMLEQLAATQRNKSGIGEVDAVMARVIPTSPKPTSASKKKGGKKAAKKATKKAAKKQPKAASVVRKAPTKAEAGAEEKRSRLHELQEEKERRGKIAAEASKRNDRKKHARKTDRKATLSQLTKQTVNPDKKPRKKHRYRPGTVALREIRRYQKNTDPVIPKKPFERLVREIVQEAKVGYLHDVRLEKEAMFALQEIAEDFIVKLMETSNLNSIFNKRVTLMDRDIKHSLRIDSRYQQYHLYRM
jgi:histone H3/H4